MNNNPIRVALIGYGTGGSLFHAPFLHALPEFEFIGVLERSKELAKVRYPYIKSYTSLDALLSNEQIELVVVTTPNDSHFSIALDALNRGKHVLVDKPFTTSSEEATLLMAAAEANKRSLSVYQNRRFHSDFKTLKSIVEEGKVGVIHNFTACFDRFRPELRLGSWKEQERPGSGIFYDLGAHLIDQALVLFGPPDSIEAKMGMERPGALAIDHFDVIFHYPNHQAVLKAGMLVDRPRPIFSLTGSLGTYLKEGADPQEGFLKEGNLPIGTEWAKEPLEQWGTLTKGAFVEKIPPLYSDYSILYKNIHDVIRIGAKPLVSSTEAALVVKCIELAIKSNVENNAKIRL